MTSTLIQRFVETVHSHPRRSLVAVFLFLVVAGAVGGPVAGALDSEGGFTTSDADSALAVERIESATGKAPGPGIVLLVDAGTDPEQVTGDLADIDGVAQSTPAGTSTDGSRTMVVGTLDADADEAAVVDEALDVFDDQQGVAVGGGAVAGKQLGDQVGKDLGRAEMFAMPILLLLSILFFGLRGAVLPLVVGATTVLGTFVVLAGVNSVHGLSIFALNLVIGLGLGLAIDYTLFLLTRYREELTVQGPTAGAVATTMRTAGRTVAFSAATVAVALATLTVFPLGFLQSMGIAGASVAVGAALSSLIVTPMFLGLWGEKLARGPRRNGAGRWYSFSHGVMRRPGLIAAVTAGVMLVLALPALRAEWTPIDDSVIPESVSARTVADTVASDFPQRPATVVVAIEGDAVQAREFASRAGELPGVAAPAEAVQIGDDTWQLDLPVAGDAAGPQAREVVGAARDLAEVTDTDALVAGLAAEFVDQQETIADTLPLGIALLVGLTLLVLWLMTGSVILPLKAVLMNALTVGVSLGAIVFVYQDGRLTDLLGYTPNGGVEASDFLVTAAIVFALSTDYGVFLLGRIKEARDSGLSEREAVAVGLGRTGSVVTAAAILLAVAIGAFSTSEVVFIQQIGIATAVGVLVDAFVVRSLLVPSLMALLGKWNWWSPMWLRRVHDRVAPDEGGSTPYPVKSGPVAAGRD